MSKYFPVLVDEFKFEKWESSIFQILDLFNLMDNKVYGLTW